MFFVYTVLRFPAYLLFFGMKLDLNHTPTWSYSWSLSICAAPISGWLYAEYTEIVK
jgi:hypothetical protein